MKFQVLTAMLVAGVLVGGTLSRVSASESTERTIQVRVSKILTERKGRLLVMLFKDDGFPVKHDRALKIKAVPVTGAAMTVPFRVPATGTFALKVLHDEDGDGRVTKKFGGIIPREGLGFSSGAKLSWSGPPKFGQAQFDAASAAAARMSIELLYP